MVRYCSVKGCKKKNSDIGIQLFYIPEVISTCNKEKQMKQKRRRTLWIKILKEGKDEIRNKYVCSKHFNCGKLSYYFYNYWNSITFHLLYAIGKPIDGESSPNSSQRYERRTRKSMIAVHHCVSSSSSLVHNEEAKNTIPPSDVCESDISHVSTMVFISITYVYTQWM